MIKNLIVPAVLVSSIVALSVMQAQSKAPCDSFQKLADGKWKVVKVIKIENGQSSVMLSTGTIIAPGDHAAGADIYAALQKTCH